MGAMTITELFADFAHRPIDAVTGLPDLTPEQLNAHPGSHPNSIAWLLWHIGRESTSSSPGSRVNRRCGRRTVSGSTSARSATRSATVTLPNRRPRSSSTIRDCSPTTPRPP